MRRRRRGAADQHASWRRPRPSTGQAGRVGVRRRAGGDHRPDAADGRSEQFNSAAVALELAWLRLFVDAGCVADEQKLQAEAAVSAYTTALQQDLAAAGYYAGAVDGVYGPMTVGAVEDLQKANGLPVTGTVDNATAAALQAELVALGGVAAQEPWRRPLRSSRR